MSRHSPVRVSLIFLVLLAAACGGAPPGRPPAEQPPTEPPPPPPPPAVRHAGLEVGWIAREPRLRAPTSLSAPITEGWPRAGSAVHWVAHVLNRNTAAAAAVPYAWSIDDTVIMRGMVDLPPGDTEVLLPWTWTFTRHRIAFAITPPDAAADPVADDNQVTVASNALSLGMWIERSTYDWMSEDGRPGFEPWLQREVARWNTILARDVFPTAPNGALDRIRVDNVIVLPDGARASNEMLFDYDLSWTVTNEAYSGDRFLELNSAPDVLADQTIILHELLHSRGLIDLYAYDVIHHVGTDEDGRINIQENGRSIVGTFLMPSLFTDSNGAMYVYFTPVDGLMGFKNNSGGRLTEHCANGLNLWAGRRTPLFLDQFGNLINALSNAVQPLSYVWKLPKRTVLTFKEPNGAPISNPTVDVYVDHNQWTYQDTYTAGPDLTLRPDAAGRVVLPGTILDNAPPTRSVPKSQVIILGVRRSEGRGFAFLPVYYLNLAYFKGNVEDATVEVEVHLHPR